MVWMINYKFFELYKIDFFVNVLGYWSIYLFVMCDGFVFYFLSDWLGGKGGFDIWKIVFDLNGNVQGIVVNLGEFVNLEVDEKMLFFYEVFFIFYFSFDGYYFMGGLDIFKSVYDCDK